MSGKRRESEGRLAAGEPKQSEEPRERDEDERGEDERDESERDESERDEDERDVAAERDSGPPRPRDETTGREGRVAGWLVTLVPFAVTLWWCVKHDEIRRIESHEGRMWLALVGMLLLVVSRLLSNRGFGLGWPRTLFDPKQAASPVKAAVGHFVIGLWLASATYGVFNYYQFDAETFTTPGDYGDVTYYYLNSKYFDELGYYNLYEAMLLADDEGPRRFRRVRIYRDLRSYHNTLPRRNALRHRDQVKGRFSPERWESFCHDLNYITSKNPNRGWQYVFTDHGYNPPPSWTLVGGAIARITPVEYLSWCTMIDFVLVLIMFACVAWAFGGPTTLVAVVWFLCTFSGRWPILGQSLLRFDWVSAVVVAICVMKKGWHGLAGGLLTYAALNRVFPAVFGFPYVVWMLREAWRARKAKATTWFRREHKAFVLGMLASLILFGGGAAVTLGVQSFRDSAHNLRIHGGPDSYSSHRVGLGDALLYRGEVTRRDLARQGGIPGKIRKLHALQPTLRVVGILCFALIALYVWRSRRAPWQTTWLGILPVFILTTPQINYFNMRLVLILLHMDLFERRGHRVALLLLFFIEAVAQYVMQNATRYTVTTSTSIGLCVYFALVIGLLVHEQLTRTDTDGDVAPRHSSASISSTSEAS